MKARFVIWGCGARGKDFCRYLESVEAFIDSSLDNQGKVVMGYPVISFEEYKKNYCDCIIIVSPADCDGIIRELESNNTFQFVRLDEAPWGVQKYIDYDMVEEVVNELPSISHIYGLSIYSILLYEKIEKANKVFPSVIAHCDIKKNRWDAIMERWINQEWVDLTSVIGQKSANGILGAIYDKGDEVKRLAIKNNIAFYDGFDLPTINSQYIHHELETFKDIHRGETGVIVCNGPSLRMADLDVLHKKNIISFGMNNIFLSFKKTKWRPTYYVAVDTEMPLEWEKNQINDMKESFFKCFFADYFAERYRKENENIYPIFTYVENKFSDYFRVSEDIVKRIYDYGSVTFDAMQIAFYMGIKRIVLLGCDHSIKRLTHFYSDGMIEYEFDDAYVDSVTRGYECIYRYAKEKGIEVVNATRGGELEVFPRVDFDSIFGINA